MELTFKETQQQKPMGTRTVNAPSLRCLVTSYLSATGSDSEKAWQKLADYVADDWQGVEHNNLISTINFLVHLKNKDQGVFSPKAGNILRLLAGLGLYQLQFARTPVTSPVPAPISVVVETTSPPERPLSYQDVVLQMVESCFTAKDPYQVRQCDNELYKLASSDLLTGRLIVTEFLQTKFVNARSAQEMLRTKELLSLITGDEPLGTTDNLIVASAHGRENCFHAYLKRIGFQTQPRKMGKQEVLLRLIRTEMQKIGERSVEIQSGNKAEISISRDTCDNTRQEIRLLGKRSEQTDEPPKLTMPELRQAVEILGVGTVFKLAANAFTPEWLRPRRSVDHTFKPVCEQGSLQFSMT